MAKNTQKILVIDDSTFMRIIIKNILKDNGYTDIFEAENGREGIEVYEKEKPDLVVLDIIMPSMDGLQTLKALRKKHEKVKVIMITAVGQEEIMEECKKVGAVGYVIKPFKGKQVAAAVKKVIGPSKK